MKHLIVQDAENSTGTAHCSHILQLYIAYFFSVRKVKLKL